MVQVCYEMYYSLNTPAYIYAVYLLQSNIFLPESVSSVPRVRLILMRFVCFES